MRSRSRCREVFDDNCQFSDLLMTPYPGNPPKDAQKMKPYCLNLKGQVCTFIV